MASYEFSVQLIAMRNHSIRRREIRHKKKIGKNVGRAFKYLTVQTGLVGTHAGPFAGNNVLDSLRWLLLVPLHFPATQPSVLRIRLGGMRPLRLC